MFGRKMTGFIKIYAIKYGFSSGRGRKGPAFPSLRSESAE
jgi:hypothetical protein